MTIREAIEEYRKLNDDDICSVCVYQDECTCDYQQCETEEDIDLLDFVGLYDALYPTIEDE